jgi:DNA-binding NarL/FixJ family response regulator
MFGSNLKVSDAKKVEELNRLLKALGECLKGLPVVISGASADPYASKLETLCRFEVGEHVCCLVRVPATLLNRLTPRQIEIATCVCRGLSNKQVAKQLNIHPYTVNVHLFRIYRKLKINSRVELTRYSVLFSI